MEVGFIGLGHMGQPMARRLLQAGHRVLAYNRTIRRAEELVADGAVLARTVEEACRAPVIITMLSDDAAVEAVVAEHMLKAMAPGAIHLSMSTISPAAATRLAHAHEQAGQRYVAAPVLGRPDAAAAAKLNILAAGEAAAIQECRPLLDAMGQAVFEMGEAPQSANTLKLAGNFLLAAMMENLSEAFAMLQKSGVDPARSLDVLTATIFPAPVYKNYGTQILQEKFEPGFKLPLGLKDIRLVLATAEAAQAPMPTASLLHDQYLSAMARGFQDLDWSALGKVVAENAGLGH